MFLACVKLDREAGRAFGGHGMADQCACWRDVVRRDGNLHDVWRSGVGRSERDGFSGEGGGSRS